MGQDRDEMSPEEKIAWQKKAMKSRNNPVIFQSDSFTKGEIDRARKNV
tara:strand:+ start:26404 stop:26547 length:144 start_codon:yes stop_codon:yes gene_type:complete